MRLATLNGVTNDMLSHRAMTNESTRNRMKSPMLARKT